MLVQVQRMKRGRVYTYPEVKEMMDEFARECAKNQEVLSDALCADHERVMLALCLRALQIQGFQKAPLERLMGEIARLSDEVNNSTIDYERDVLKPVEDALGYPLEDDSLMEDLGERIKVGGEE